MCEMGMRLYMGKWCSLIALDYVGIIMFKK